MLEDKGELMSLIQEDTEEGVNLNIHGKELQRVSKCRLKNGKHTKSTHRKGDKLKDDLNLSRNISYILHQLHQTHSLPSPQFLLI